MLNPMKANEARTSLGVEVTTHSFANHLAEFIQGCSLRQDSVSQCWGFEALFGRFPNFEYEFHWVHCASLRVILAMLAAKCKMVDTARPPPSRQITAPNCEFAYNPSG